MGESSPDAGTLRKQFASRLKMSAIATIVAGVICMSFPLAIGLLAVIIVGIGMLGAGAVSFVTAWRAPSDIPGRSRYLLESAAIVAVGVLILLAPWVGSAILTWILAVPVMVVGVSRIATGFELRPRAGWIQLATVGTLLTLFALALLAGWPFSGAYLAGSLLGAVLVMDGTVRFMAARMLASKP